MIKNKTIDMYFSDISGGVLFCWVSSSDRVYDYLITAKNAIVLALQMELRFSTDEQFFAH